MSSNICNHCTVKGYLKRCLSTDCQVHDSWAFKEIRKNAQVENIRKTELNPKEAKMMNDSDIFFGSLVEVKVREKTGEAMPIIIPFSEKNYDYGFVGILLPSNPYLLREICLLILEFDKPVLRNFNKESIDGEFFKVHKSADDILNGN